MSDDLIRLKEELSILQKELKELKQDALDKQVSNKKHTNKIEEHIDLLDKGVNVFKRLSDIPGVRSPAWYRVDIPFTYGETQTRFGQTQISPVGPFVCTQIQCYYLNADANSEHYRYAGIGPTFYTSNAAGRTLPPTSFWDLFGANKNFSLAYIGSLFQRNLDAVDFAEITNREVGFGWNYPEFNIQIEIAGSNRYWTGQQKIPAAAFYGYTNPLFVGFEGVVENTDSIVVHAQPSTSTVNLTGSLVAEFHGYHINAHINVKQLMGY